MAAEGEGQGFREPRVGLSRIYTRTGDAGETGLVGGQRVPKDSLRIEAYGTVDELNAAVGLCRAAAALPPSPLPALSQELLRVQHQLFNLGSVLATLPQEVGPRQPRPTDADVAWLESVMDRATAQLAPLSSFVLAGDSMLHAHLHLARTVCRRAERLAVALRREGGCGDVEVRYLNRLSDALFVWSRWAARQQGLPETLWQPNQG
jgi:cob(I)alamin adenosyltransferase